LTDQYSLCLSDYITQLRTLAAIYFPAVTGKAAGWQVSENDTVVKEGGDYFIVLRPGSFETARHGQHQDNIWRVRTLLFMRFNEYDSLWTAYRLFRSDILALPDTAPMTAHGIYNQTFSASDEAGYVRDDAGNYVGFIQQTLEATIMQRVLIARAF